MTEYGYESRGAAFLALVPAWVAAGVVAFFAGYTRSALVHGWPETDGGPQTFTGRLLLFHLPTALFVALAAWPAGRLHREPFRYVTSQHLLAVCAVPVVAQFGYLLVNRPQLALEDWLMSAAVLVVGCVAGYAVDQLREG